MGTGTVVTSLAACAGMLEIGLAGTRMTGTSGTMLTGTISVMLTGTIGDVTYIGF